MSSSDESDSVSLLSSPENLISEVQKRPALYDKNCVGHNNKDELNRLWNEVASNLCKNWNNLSEKEKIRKREHIRKRWKNVKDYFSRELNIQQLGSKQGLAKKRKYRYFDSLLFLLPVLDKNKSNTKIISSQETCVKKKQKTSEKVDCPINYIDRNNGSDQKVFDTVNHNAETELDEDICFSQMLVPMLRKLNEDQKHYARINILNILQKAKSYQFTEPGVPDVSVYCSASMSSKNEPCLDEDVS